MKAKYILLIFLFSALFRVTAQEKTDSLQAFENHPNLTSQKIVADSLPSRDSLLIDSLKYHPFTINYSLRTEMGNSRGIAETYNGALKTVIVGTNKVKIKLAGLMRTQFLLYNFHPQANQPQATMVKESGRDRYILHISQSAWPQYAQPELYSRPDSIPGDTMKFFGLKTVAYQMKLADGKILKAYILQEVNREILKESEPFLGQFPGLPFQYEIKHGNHSIIYSAVALHFTSLPENIFDLPKKGYAIKKFVKQNGENKLQIEDDDDAEDDDATSADSTTKINPKPGLPN